MPSNGKEFAAFLRRVADELPEQTYMSVFRRIAFRLLEVAVQTSPVNTGRLRNSWQMTIGAASAEEAKVGDDAASVLAAGGLVINEVRFGQSLWMQNGVPYAPVIEYGLYDPPDPGPSKATHVPKSRRDRVKGTTLIEGGFHVSAPEGMLGDAIQTVIEAYDSGTL